MYKYIGLFVLVLATLSVDARSRHRRAEPNLRNDALEVYNNAKTNFPNEEFQAFWNAVKAKSGQTQSDLKAKFDANKGNMDMTLEQLFDKTQEDYPILTQQWNRVKSQWEAKKGELEGHRGSSIQDLFNMAKGKLEAQLGEPITFEKFQGKISQYLAAINMQGSRRFKREANLHENYQAARTHIEQNFPKDEFNAFLNALSEKAQMTKGEIKAKLDANKGNMDLTLEELSSKVQNDYPILNQQWNRVKSQWDGVKDNLDDTTVNDLYTKLNGQFKAKFGDVDPAQFYAQIKNYLASTFAGLSQRRYRREIPSDVQQMPSHIAKNFPKAEWDAFYSKLEDAFRGCGMNLQEKITQHEGNMDLTLKELQDKAMDKYPKLEREWSKVKTQMDNSVDKMDETTVKDMFYFVKKHAESVLGRPLTEQSVKEFVGNMKTYMTTFFARMQNRAYY